MLAAVRIISLRQEFRFAGQLQIIIMNLSLRTTCMISAMTSIIDQMAPNRSTVVTVTLL